MSKIFLHCLQIKLKTIILIEAKNAQIAIKINNHKFYSTIDHPDKRTNQLSLNIFSLMMCSLKIVRKISRGKTIV